MLPPLRRPHRRPREWAMHILCYTVLVWLAISMLFASKLSILKRAPSQPHLAPDLTSGKRTQPLHQSHQNRRQLGVDKLNNTSQPSPQPLFPPLLKVDPRISGLGPALPWDTLHGGWQFTKEVYDRATQHPNATVISWERPRAVLIKGFLSPEEVDHMVETAEAGFQRSEVVADQEVISKARTSYGAWLNGARRTPTVLQIQDRIAKLAGIPEEFGESLYVLRYETSQKYDIHTDHCHHTKEEALTESCKAFLKRSGGPECGPGAGGVTCGDRLATVIIYLKTPKRGGATVFPLAERVPPIAQPPREFNGDLASLKKSEDRKAVGPSERARGSAGIDSATGGTNSDDVPLYCRDDGTDSTALKTLPESGDAVVFFDYIPGEDQDGLAMADPTSAHAGCPPIEGTKMIATRWIRSAEFS